MMFKTILVPTDGSALSGKAIHAALAFAKQLGAKIVAISVAEPYPFYPISENEYSGGSILFEEKSLEAARQHVQRVAAEAAQAKVPCETLAMLSSTPYQEIVDAAQRLHCDLIFMASHGRTGLSKLFVGSETQKVLAHTTIPVLVFR